MSSGLKNEEVVRELYHEERMSTRDIARKFDVDPATAYYWVDKHGIETRDRSESQGGASFDEEQLRRLYVEEEMTTIEIGEKFGVDPSNVSRAMQKFGIESREYKGEDNWNWDGGEAETDCFWCGEQFTLSRSRFNDAKRNFCSHECMHSWMAEYQKQVGRDRITLECEYCGGEFETWPFKSDRRFCSHECRDNSDYRSGENHWNWQGGHCYRFGYNWDTQREKRLEYDGYECVVCGLSDKEHRNKFKDGLHVHHIQARRNFTDENGDIDWRSANAVDNLVSLCVVCHRKWEGIPLKPDVR